MQEQLSKRNLDRNRLQPGVRNSVQDIIKAARVENSKPGRQVNLTPQHNDYQRSASVDFENQEPTLLSHKMPM
jgi:hypothetical protein